MKSFYLTLSLILSVAFSQKAARIMHVPMDLSGREAVKETVSGKNLFLFSKTYPENIAGAEGNALRFDGFSTYIQGQVNAGQADAKALTFSLWIAPETYPVIALDTPTEEKMRLAGTLDDASHSGWQFLLGYTGKYAFECYSGGWKVSVNASDIIPCYEWSHLVAVVDATARKATLYRNGMKVGESNTMDSFDNTSSRLTVGRSVENKFTGPFMLNTFNGLIDEIEVFDTALSAAEINAYSPKNEADLSVPESRYENQTLRPRFHGMPATAWTNESHGMTYSEGRYHVFFQKNANGPYMTRLHWGHISSADLLNWKEEKIAIAPGEAYDVKGCWSGTIVTDDVLTGGKPAAIYTGVDYAKAAICMAMPEDESLKNWTKYENNPIISGKPAGLSDDFRDPYFFRNGNDAYLIVGTSKNGHGAVTLHKMDPVSKSFSNDGRIFFEATNVAEHGTFWEMPNITRMENGKWLFTVTPQNTSKGVRCLYWVGSINNDGTFKAETEARTVELTSQDGYGLLSPTVYTHNGRTIALGIVPDKVSAENNYSLGWAHCYSLPREWSLTSDGSLLQKPVEEAKTLRSGKTVSDANFQIAGTRILDGVEGSQVELLGVFKVGATPFGFTFFGNGTNQAKLYYNPASGELIADFSALNRWNNDAGSYSGIYRMALPERPAAGSELKLNVFLDGSIVDIFVNDKWAQSIRVFPQSENASEVGLYAEGQTEVKSLDAWNLKTDGAGVGNIFQDGVSNSPELVNVYHVSGMLVKHQVTLSEAFDGLDSGIYILNGRKVKI